MAMSLSAMSKESRLSPRCYNEFPSPSHSRTSSRRSHNSTFSFSTATTHSRQSSLDHTAALHIHSRESSIDSFDCSNGRRYGAKFRHKLSPSSVDMGYHTLLGSEDTSPFASLEIKQQRQPRHYDYDLLDNDVWLHILGYLSSEDLCGCARVSRRFYFLVWEPRLWRNIRIYRNDVNGDLALCSVFRLLSTRGCNQPIVKSIYIRNTTRLTDVGVGAIADQCPDLRRLQLLSCRSVSFSKHTIQNGVNPDSPGIDPP